MIDRFEPFLVSEHLAWSRIDGASFPDLLPFPRTNEALELIARNIDITQDVLGRQILIENPSLYMQLEGHEWAESLFLAELVKRTGCGLLIDVNNVFVSAATSASTRFPISMRCRAASSAKSTWPVTARTHCSAARY